MADLHHPHTGDLKAPPINGQSMEDRTLPRAGRPPMESYSAPDKRPVVDDSLAQHYRERCSRFLG